MLVSLLQLMGFAQGKPVQSAPASPAGALTVASGSSETAASGGARRLDVTKPLSRPSASGARAAAAGRTPTTKPTAKLSAKVPAKVQAKSSASAKPAAKPAVKAAASSGKAAVQKAATPSKAAPSQASKVASPSASAKPAAKVATAKVTTAKLTTTEGATGKTAAPATPRPASKVAPVKSAKVGVPKQAAPSLAPSKSDVAAKASSASRTPSPSAHQAAAKAAAHVINQAASKTTPKPAAAPVSAAKPAASAKAVAPAATKPTLVAVAVTPAAGGAYVPPKLPGRVGRTRGPIGVVFTQTPVVASTAAKTHFSPNHSLPQPPAPVTVAPKKDAKLANNWKTKSAEELTEAEVIAMPDSEYMNEKQLAFFRSKLLRLKHEILTSAGETTEHLRDDTVVVPDPADRATIEEEHALELRTRDRERKLLKKIEQSVARIDAGDYGYCDETGEPIGVPRLLARPTATLSLEAQQRRELKQKMFGD
jgi:DnaK suppressor protein